MLCVLVTLLVICASTSAEDIWTFQSNTSNIILGDKLAHCDVNGDGFTDLVTASWNSSLFVFLGQKDGSFKNTPDTFFRVSNTTDTKNMVLECADINTDGYSDLVFALWDTLEPVVVFNGTPQGLFSTGILLNYTSDDVTTMMADDFNNDGFLDLAITSYFGDLLVYSGMGAEGLNPSPTSCADHSDGNFIFTSAVSCDLAGDSFPDIVILRTDGTFDFSLSIFSNQEGSFQSPLSFKLPCTDWCTYQDLACGDINGDGRMDIVLSGAAEVAKHALLLFYGTGKVSSFPKQPSVAVSSTDLVLGVDIHDINRDGYGDILGATVGNPALNVWFGRKSFDSTTPPDFASSERTNAGFGVQGLPNLNGKGTNEIFLWSNIRFSEEYEGCISVIYDIPDGGSSPSSGDNSVAVGAGIGVTVGVLVIGAVAGIVLRRRSKFLVVKFIRLYEKRAEHSAN